MDPYRVAAFSSPATASTHEGDGEVWLLWALFLLGVIGVVPATLRPGHWGAEPSLGLLLVVVAGRRLVVRYAQLGLHRCRRQG